MKTLVMFLGFGLVLLSGAFSQERPLVVDNSRYFPPVRNQQTLANCSHFALIYDLKSALWNQEFNRDPSLEKNQFSHGFVWNQNINPIFELSQIGDAYYFMQNQGCATVAEFSINEQSDKLKPDFDVRERALVYKSKGLYSKTIFSTPDSNSVNANLNELKDSLINGTPFVIVFPIFDHFENIGKNNTVYSFLPGDTPEKIRIRHDAVVVGYNDTIKTAQGRGAFIVKNSSDRTDGGIFYFDYNWFYFLDYPLEFFFLEEDFSAKPELALNLELAGLINSVDIYKGKYIFTDTVIGTVYNKFDFVNNSTYLYNRNQVQVVEVNGSRLPLRNNAILFPANNTDGNYQLVSDVTPLLADKDFKSLSVIVFDPISVAYYDASNTVMYNYERAASAQVDNAFLSFIGTDKKIRAKVKELADTTFVFNDFYSFRLGLNLDPRTGNTVFVKKHTAKVKRKLITFSITDVEVNAAPVFIQVPSALIGYPEKEVSFQLVATDAEEDSLSYFLKEGPATQLLKDGSIGYPGTWSLNSVSGLFKFQGIQESYGEFTFIVAVTDGLNTVQQKLVVRIVESPVAFTNVPSSLGVNFGQLISKKFGATSQNSEPIIYSIVSGPLASMDSSSGEFLYTGHAVGEFTFVIKAQSGEDFVFASFLMKVYPFDNLAVFVDYPQDTLVTNINKELEFIFTAYDADGDTFYFFLDQPIPEASITADGKLTFLSDKVGLYNVTVGLSDGLNISFAEVVVRVTLNSGIKDIRTDIYKLSFFPNPLQEQGRASFFLSERTAVSLSLYDVSGRLIDSIANGEYEAGEQEVFYDASQLASGVYLVLFKTKGLYQTFKIVKQ